MAPQPVPSGQHLTRRTVTTAAKRGGTEELSREARQQVKEGAEAVKQTGFLQRLAAAQAKLNGSEVNWTKLLGTSLLIGTTFGFAFQVTHNQGLLPAYDVWNFKVGPFLEAGTIPIVLAPIWVLYAYLQPLVDAYFDGDAAVERAIERARSPGYLVANWVVLALMFILSDVLYLQDFPHWQISAILAPIWLAGNWAVFDRTRGGLLLGLLLAVGAPAGEMIIVNFLHLWHYDRPDLFGVPHWAGWCYAAYAHGVGNVGRYLLQAQQKEDVPSSN